MGMKLTGKLKPMGINEHLNSTGKEDSEIRRKGKYRLLEQRRNFSNSKNESKQKSQQHRRKDRRGKKVKT